MKSPEATASEKLAERATERAMMIVSTMKKREAEREEYVGWAAETVARETGASPTSTAMETAAVTAPPASEQDWRWCAAAPRRALQNPRSWAPAPSRKAGGGARATRRRVPPRKREATRERPGDKVERGAQNEVEEEAY